MLCFQLSSLKKKQKTFKANTYTDPLFKLRQKGLTDFSIHIYFSNSENIY